ncbi:lipid A deacylase LpxR family protein [Azospirillum halopraeferens]|uniref:lipid A deacylase LpxR family protein n=1 Tax=Azospirillum halopraeferens TaxID=34010 RepID=UPI00040CBB60|nr:lipid A deacylase LpxR family protein [Azospirillum halopraeferens]
MALAAAGGAGPAAAQTAFGFWLDNDLFAGTDRYYTNGVQVYYISDALPTLGVMDWLADRLVHPGEPAARRYGFALGQAMYAPQDLTRRELITDDRPYAGWLYGRLSLLSTTPRAVDRIDLDVGIVGPASLAEPTQKLVHRVVPDATRPMGWHNQLRNEPGVILSYEHVWRDPAPVSIGPLSLDIAPHAAGSLGNVLTFAGTGFTMRLGQNMPAPLGSLVTRPTAAIPFHEGAHPAPYSWYVYAATEVRAVARNIFLDGNTFVSSHSVDRNTLVGSLQIGVSARWGEVGISYAHSFITPEFRGQDGVTSYGSLRLSMLF